MNYWRFGLLVVSCFAATSAWAFNEPTGFRDIPWGTAEKSVGAKIKLDRCGPSERFDYGTRQCRADDSVKIGEVQPLALRFYFREDKLVGWTVSYHRLFRNEMLPTLIEKYGKPTKETPTLVLWSGAMTQVQWSAYGDNDTVMVLTKDEIAKTEADRKVKAGKAAKDF